MDLQVRSSSLGTGTGALHIFFNSKDLLSGLSPCTFDRTFLTPGTSNHACITKIFTGVLSGKINNGKGENCTLM